MDILTAWAATDPAVARLLWVLVLVLATLLVWLFFFCCYSWNQRSSPSLERYLAGRLARGVEGPSLPPLWVCGGLLQVYNKTDSIYCELLMSSQAWFY